jgi:cell division protein ZapA
MEESNTTTGEILGREYRIRGGGDSDYVREVARYVDTKLKEVSRGAAGQSADRVAVLAAMNIADELFQARRSTSEQIQDIERQAEGLINLLDATFAFEPEDETASSRKG